MDRLTRIQVADLLLRSTSLNGLRAAARHSQSWQSVFRGFRPDHLSRPDFVRGTLSFGNNLALLESLCNAFLDDLKVPKVKVLRSRFEAAVNLPVLSDELRQLCVQLSAEELSSLAVAPLSDREETDGAGVGGLNGGGEPPDGAVTETISAPSTEQFSVEAPTHEV